MRVHTPHKAQALCIAAQPVIPQFHIPVRSHRDIHNLAVSCYVHSDFTSQIPAHRGQERHQFPREKIGLIDLVIIER